MPTKKTFDIISRREVEALIADGKHIIIVDQHVMKVDAWLPYHPGGDKAIKHMVGRDATDEVNGWVPSSPYHVSRRWSIRRADPGCLGCTLSKLGAEWIGIESVG